MALVKYNNNSISAITSTGLTTGAMTLIKEQTASSSSTISFVDGTSDVVLDNTYPIYLFKFINIHPSNDGIQLKFNMSIDSGSNYNVTKTSSAFSVYHNEGDSTAEMSYQASQDLAQSTSPAFLSLQISNDNDGNCNGYLKLFGVSSTTFVKHWLSECVDDGGDYSVRFMGGGYGNTTSAVDAIQFSLSAGTMDSGTIKLYGIKDS